MAKTQFQKNVDAGKSVFNSRKEETSLEDLSIILPLIGSVLQKAEGALEEAKYIIAELPSEVVLMSELSQAVGFLKGVLGKKFEDETARFQALQEKSSQEEAQESDPVSE